MTERNSFDLSAFMADSLSLHSISNWNTRKMFPNQDVNPMATIYRQDPLEVLGEKSFGSPHEIPDDIFGTPIQEFFRGKHVFITGGTGFIGKLLTEKLLRSVPHIGHVYLLIRAKRGKLYQDRFEQLFQDRVFGRLRAEVPQYRSKVSAVEGDLATEGLGLAEADRRLLADRVHVVFHSAADVRFIEPLRAAIESNVYGSRRVLQLAKQMTNIVSFVHVSTAYSQCVRRVVTETIPKMSLSYEAILKDIESLTDDELNEQTDKIMQGWPNTYTFSKALCEDMMREEAGRIPVCIFRPSAVVSTYREPVRGYTDNLYGAMGLVLAMVVGVLHCFTVDYDLNLDMVPVDCTVNCLIAAAWNTATAISNRENTRTVYNYTSSPANTNGTSWRYILGVGNSHQAVWPMSQAIWYPSFVGTSNVTLDKIAHVFLHRIPGAVLDKIAEMSGRKPLLTKVYKRLEAVRGPVRFFTFRVWEFRNDNVWSLWNRLNDDDKKIFNFDIRDGNAYEFLNVGKLGLRYYFLKETMESLPSAEFKNKWLRIAHLTLKTATGLLALKVLACLSHFVPI